MWKVISLSLLILCDILSPGTGIVSEGSRGKVNSARTPNITVDDIEKAPYVVNIHKNGGFICGGSIVESNIIITAAHCVEDRDGIYIVYSGSVQLKHGIPHDVYRIIRHPGYHNKTFNDDLALLTIHPPIDFLRTPARRIPIYNNMASLMRVQYGIISGWGCAGFRCISRCFPGIPIYPKMLRSFDVVTVEQRICARSYPEVTDKNVCTTHSSVERKYCSDGDSGNPLVVNNQLLGILVWSVKNPNKNIGPDVSMNLAHPENHEWVTRTISRIRN